MAYKALDIAKKLIRMADWDTANGGDNMTNLRLQKMLYYEQGYHLAKFGTPLFEESIEAWMYGPVVPIVYDHYKDCGAQILPIPTDEIDLTEEEEDLFVEVFEAYRDFSTIGLMNLTHKERPWLNAVPHNKGTEIKQSSMERFFKTQLD
ncbi:MAG: DUF4065 domain-containing protein [Bacteroidales bacterium]|nr:DUF4065 domain-containing protein [Bacteroidales bacterium]